MNPLSDNLVTGVVGELLVQLRLLQYGVQAAPPLWDTGNDLIGVRGGVFRAIQVKTSRQDNPSWSRPDPEREYHLLALVGLTGEDNELELDESDIYLIPREELGGEQPPDLPSYSLTDELVDRLFAPSGEGAPATR